VGTEFLRGSFYGVENLFGVIFIGGLLNRGWLFLGLYEKNRKIKKKAVFSY